MGENSWFMYVKVENGNPSPNRAFKCFFHWLNICSSSFKKPLLKAKQALYLIDRKSTHNFTAGNDAPLRCVCLRGQRGSQMEMLGIVDCTHSCLL